VLSLPPSGRPAHCHDGERGARLVAQSYGVVKQSLADPLVAEAVSTEQWGILRARPAYDKRAEFIDVTKSPGRMTNPSSTSTPSAHTRNG